ncbi:MAG TPA: translation initiation factor IF-3 [Candidatus Jacksonbacteria bacterium]|nr:MAG: Translation initiation factor IF-3 [Parcubacteria group bacterium GW2011_GWC2_44_22]OGY76892.1 MAG: translation initiation factor IF-3 [Candidatus Jacksonbacteria bacterium RIFOXYA2_FULL_43_12]OGY77343.1 MAG: translation initiation factor IF-3 [Candidatus Jacksonbacteria bacterium RIFOXYB2_FULL_44_15]OGY82284.1 MAG: translation initiation factor IF-3 [Candidatus Jacksonbacteria bacterium RIFOXYD2_FULL_43_21]HBH46225.1 translation initiation factor IF-3 [Candidatus Jacksonbacteria bacter
MGRRHYHKKKPPSKHYRFNQQIKAPEVKLIDADGEFLGVMSTALALRKAEEQGLDLIEISPKDNPPIAKIIDFGKFKYEQEKKKQKSTPRKIETKSIRLNLNMASHDLETRENQTRKFLELNCRAQMEMSLKGREKIHSKRAFDQMNEFLNRLNDVADVIQPVILKGQRLSAIIKPRPR